MIIEIRKRMHGRAIKIIALILVAMFVLPLSVTQMVHFFFQSSPWIASVNKYMISPEDITTARYCPRLSAADGQTTFW